MSKMSDLARYSTLDDGDEFLDGTRKIFYVQARYHEENLLRIIYPILLKAYVMER